MSDFKAWFRNRYGAEFPVVLETALHEHDEQVWVSENLIGKLEFPPMVPEFRDEPEYLVTGEWGRGINTYAFYLVERRGAHQRFFRIFSGGVYGQAEEDRRMVVDYLAGYQRWRERFEGTLASSTLVCNMDQSSADLVSASGARLQHSGDEEGAAWWDALEARMP